MRGDARLEGKSRPTSEAGRSDEPPKKRDTSNNRSTKRGNASKKHGTNNNRNTKRGNASKKHERDSANGKQWPHKTQQTWRLSAA